MAMTRSTAAVAKAPTYEPEAWCIMPENRGPVLVRVLCAESSALNTPRRKEVSTSGNTAVPEYRQIASERLPSLISRQRD